MNLLQTPWLPFRLRDGSQQTLPITSICRSDIIDFALPREDFQGAAYQFSIGLLQTVFAPEDEEAWGDFYHTPPTENDLQQAFDTVAHVFMATGNGPLFMQDFETLSQEKPTPITGLLIEAPGANAIKQNTDHFVKRDLCDVMSLDMAILALFTLQINAPSGGSGHRVGLRGGGPLTTLVLPDKHNSSLWKKLWLNVMHRDYYRYDDPDFTDGSVFPWLAPTKVSSKKGTEIYSTEVHPLHMYWAMPRRIRLQVSDTEAVCHINGKASKQTVSTFVTKNYGGNYSGNWEHPFTPYKWNPKKPNEEHLSIKGQQGGITYKIWDLLTLTSNTDGQRCATAAAYYQTIAEYIKEDHSEKPRLWAFAYDMDNMKARCWYSVTLPLFSVAPEHLNSVFNKVKELQVLANFALWHCRTQVKSAWFEKPSEVKGNMLSVDLAFWPRSEATFFKAVQQIIQSTTTETNSEASLTPQQAKVWLNQLRAVCTDLFDEIALSEEGSDRSMARAMKARHRLTGWLYGGKEIKRFTTHYNIPSTTKTPAKDIA